MLNIDVVKYMSNVGGFCNNSLIVGYYDHRAIRAIFCPVQLNIDTVS